jgi:hypothetical protein
LRRFYTTEKGFDDTSITFRLFGHGKVGTVLEHHRLGARNSLNQRLDERGGPPLGRTTEKLLYVDYNLKDGPSRSRSTSCRARISRVPVVLAMLGLGGAANIGSKVSRKQVLEISVGRQHGSG